MSDAEAGTRSGPTRTTQTGSSAGTGSSAEGFSIGRYRFRSRLIIGSGKYESFEQNLECAEASGAEMVTVALRRVNFDAAQGPRLLDVISPDRFTILPNTAGCYTAKDAITTAQMGRELLGTELVKLEVIGDERTLFPDVPATLEAARILIDDGFTVLPYITDDPVACQRLAAMGCPAVMPLAAPIGSGMGIRNPANLRIILETVEVPVIVDAGVGTASDAAFAMELGAAALLMNTAIAHAKEPVKMATAMRLAVEAGRLAYEAGRMPKRLYASASSPLDGTATF
jgi:thiazole synthase